MGMWFVFDFEDNYNWPHQMKGLFSGHTDDVLKQDIKILVDA